MQMLHNTTNQKPLTEGMQTKAVPNIGYVFSLAKNICLQCFDAVGWEQEGHPACKN